MIWKKFHKAFFKNRKWNAHPFQEECAGLYFKGYNGLLNAPTGSGKTYALSIPVIIEYLEKKPKGLQLLWVSPLKALGNDIRKAVYDAAQELEADWQVSIRNGDTSTAERQKQIRRPPECLVITPESLHLLLAQKKCSEIFSKLNCVVVDEWHELIGNKRGVQVELAISRLQSFVPKLKVWGISATIGNLEDAMNVLLPMRLKSKLVIADFKKEFEINTLIPEEIDSFPWFGHIGLSMLPQLLPVFAKSGTTLVFTNTRSQSEIWYQNILANSPHLAGQMAIHHGSLTQEVRRWVEENLHSGLLKVVVCTSSLDLGVDFRPVDTVVQIGSPKGVARFVQRAGRSGHRPGEISRMYFVPTNSFELVEAAALKQSMDLGIVESKVPIVRAFDVLIQYLMTLAVGEGFVSDDTFLEVKQTHAYADISLDEWNWALSFLVTGGETLDAYDEYKKVEKIGNLYKVESRRTAMRHRMNVGTIASVQSMLVKQIGGKALGTIEESFLTRLKPEESFVYAGKKLQVSRFEGTVAYVRKSKAKKATVPSWSGGRMSLTSELSEQIRLIIDGYKTNKRPEMKCLKGLFETQSRISVLPNKEELLMELYNDKSGHHLFVYPFEGRMVNEGMAILIAYRIGKFSKVSFSVSMNDYGFELLCDEPIPVDEMIKNDVFSPVNLTDDLLNCHNYSQMTQKKFSEIAVISGLLIKNMPGKQMKQRHLQSTSGLLFKVFNEHDSDNILMQQARQEVLYQQLEEHRLRAALHKTKGQKLLIKKITEPSPYCFGLLVDRLRESFSNESLVDRIKKMKQANSAG